MGDVEGAVAAVRGVVPVELCESWFVAVCEANLGAGGDWARFVELLTGLAGQAGVGSAAVEVFAEYVSAGGEPLSVVGEMCARRDELPGRYAALVTSDAGVGPETGAAGPEALEWVTDGQRVLLAGGLGDGWPGVLRAKLVEVWPDWVYADEGELVSFLDGWAEAIVEENGPDAAAPVDAGGIERAVAAELAGRTELSAAVSPEEFERLVAEVMRERVGA